MIAEFLSGRPGAVLLCALIFMFLVGLEVSGHSTPSVQLFTPQFGGALLMALGLDRMKVVAPEKPSEEVAK